MRNIWLVLKREYMVRVRKKSFIVMTILGPLLVAAFYGVIFFVAIKSDSGSKKVQIIDQTDSFSKVFKNGGNLQYTFTNQPLDSAKKQLVKGGFDLLVSIPKNVVKDPSGVKMFAEKNVSLDLKSDVEKIIETEIENRRLAEAGINIKILQDSKANVNAETYSLSDEGEKSSNSFLATGIAFFCAFLIYISVFVYGAQIMRSVMEEKTSRIVEVIISSVKPFQLMMGKIIGVGLVGLTQFLLWIILSATLLSAGTAILGSRYAEVRTGQVTQLSKDPNVNKAKADGMAEFNNVLNQFSGSQALQIAICFLIYFLGGYLIYGALFGAIGAAVDSETDTQQFMLPVMLPIIAAIALAQFALKDPDGSIAFWGSMIPLTSPILMMVRIPFGVPTWQLFLSIGLLIVGFVSTIWLASRIYRVGILMYGKKVTYRELSKWIFYKG